MNCRITVMLHMEPLNLSELLSYNKVLAIGTDFAGCFLSPRGYAWIDMSKRTADKSNLQTVGHCLLLTCLKSPGMQANIFRGVLEASVSYCRCRGPGCAQLRRSDNSTAPRASAPNGFRNSSTTDRHPEQACSGWGLGWDLLLRPPSFSAKLTGELSDICQSVVRQFNLRSWIQSSNCHRYLLHKLQLKNLLGQKRSPWAHIERPHNSSCCWIKACF